MGAIISKLCCGFCIPKTKSNSEAKSWKFRTRIPSLIIERSQLTRNNNGIDELSEMTQYTRVLEKDFEVKGRRGKTTTSNFLKSSQSVVDNHDDHKQREHECKLFQLKHKETGQMFTLTRIPKLGLSLESARNLCREIGLLAGSLPHHPLLVNLYWSWQDEEYLYRVDDSVNDDTVNVRITVHTISALVVAIHYIHSYGLVHGNINPHTAMHYEGDKVRLSGFNHLRRVKGGARLSGPSGDFPDFQAPECKNSKCEGYFEEIDWYSLGKCLQFWHQNGQIKSDNGDDHDDLKDLIEKLTRKRAEDRLGYGPAGFKSIQSHCFFAQTNWSNHLHHPNHTDTHLLARMSSSLKTSIDSLKSICSAEEGWQGFVEFNWDEREEIGEFLEGTLIRMKA